MSSDLDFFEVGSCFVALVEPQMLQRRAELARRLKAARWLAGGVRPAEKGKAGWEVYALSPEDLAKRDGMAENQMSASKIGSIERMERHTPPMEIAVLADALGLSTTWFTQTAMPEVNQPALDLLQQALADLGLVPDPSQEAAPSAGADQEQPDQSAAGGDA